MKNTITKDGAKALKQMLFSTKLENAQIDMMGGFIDIMTQTSTSDDDVYNLMSSQANTINKLKEDLIIEKEASENLINELEKINSMRSNKNKEQGEEIDRLKKELKQNNELIQGMETQEKNKAGKIICSLNRSCEYVESDHDECKDYDRYNITIEKRNCENCGVSPLSYCENHRNNCPRDNYKFWKPKK